MRSLVREPLVHFLLLGALLLGAWRVVSPPPPAASRRIDVDAGVVAGLVRDFERRSGRAPSSEERRGLIDRYVESELLYREAIALGLDRGDVIVRRRLVQKMEIVAGIADTVGGPDAIPDTELAAELSAHPDRWMRPARLSFEHVFVARDRHDDPAAEAAHLRTEILDGKDASGLGDPFLRGASFPLATEAEIASAFGPAFAASVSALAERKWSTPVPSSYGLHLVRVTGREAARPARLDEVRDRVVEELRERRRSDARRAALDRLKARYTIALAEAL